MAEEKALKDKTDFYSLRRRATMDIIRWKENSVPDIVIKRRIGLTYGFTEKFFNKIINTYGLSFDDVPDS